MQLSLSCLIAGNMECLNCFSHQLIAAYNSWSVVQYLVGWSESTANRNHEVKFQKCWEPWFYLAHIILPQTSTHLPYQKRSFFATLNLHNFFEMMMDIEMENLPSIVMRQYQHILQHCPVHMLNKLINDCTSKVLLY